MKRILSMITFAVVMALPFTASAFDGNRAGFVLGGGVGVSPVAQFKTVDNSGRSVGFGLHIIIGYAWDNRNLAALETNTSLYYNGQFNSTDMSLFSKSSLLTSQGFEGAVWYHYFGGEERSPFSTIGLGIYAFDRGGYYHSDPGAGYLLGCGCQFFRHFQIGLYFSGGRTFDSHNFGHKHLSLLLTGLMY